MPVWRIVWDKDESNYSWEVCHSGIESAFGEEFEQTKATAVDECHSPIACGASLRDVLVHGCAELAANVIDENVALPQLFKTGLGKPVAIKQTSLLKAMAVLGSDGFDRVGKIFEKGGDLGFSNAHFGTKTEEMMINLPFAGFSKPEKLSHLKETSSNHGCSWWSEQVINPSTNSSCAPDKPPDSSHLASVYTPGSALGHFDKTTFCGKESAQTLELDKTTSAPTPIKFQTAGGRSISVSSHALKHAISLLGDPELGSFLDKGDDIEIPLFSALKHGRSSDCSSDRSGDMIINQQHAQDHQVCDSNEEMEHLLEHTSSGTNQQSISFVGLTADDTFYNKKHTFPEKRAFGKHSITPFKRPRSSVFSLPSNNTRTVASSNEAEGFYSKRRVSNRYLFKANRIYFKDFFGMPSLSTDVDLMEEIRLMNPHTTDTYVFRDGLHPECIGVGAVSELLVSSLGSTKYPSIEWVVNHYRWILWKFASYERSYIGKCKGKILTLNNVLEELKYRYEREVNFGHKSSIRKILDGSLPPSSVMVLCISGIGAESLQMPKSASGESVEALSDNFRNIELTDGWYSITARLDKLLSLQLAAGKLYVGQKLRIWGAKLTGWIEAVSPLEVPQESRLVLHMNGTYRAHWADRLGECKSVGPPLALKCIKKTGGCVPQTLLGLTRIYPVLFKERLDGGVSAVRSQKSEKRIMQLFEERCCNVMESIVSEFEKDVKDCPDITVNNSEEGAKILRMLERSAEPEVLMADMSIDQLTSLATYKKKLETERQVDMEKLIEKALDSAGISTRDVSSFMRLKVVGLSSIQHEEICDSKQAIVTIWNPTEIQQSELMEGHAYVVTGLEPLNSDSHELHMRAKGPNSTWNSLSPSEIEYFKPFFVPRKAISISNLGEIPLSGEFDTAALIVYVGEVYGGACRGKQWVFVTDDSICGSDVENLSYAFLAICFFVPHVDDSFAPFSNDLVGSTVGFCNLTKRENDQVNSVWMAGATENSAYFTKCDSSHCSHLKEASISVRKWASSSSATIEKLRRRVLSFFDDSLH